ncbi:chemotaxis-specific protein-glutamate methyltransferase CheB [Chondromyces crocatus]|uniref:Protein-glutamate methylesterase/protein-glutamine glutaminase n=1 Tax=Chondromyces crocatus TaxID=52 RepID=A0A0K1E5R0_CHOCO|nr:chemotaxis-specific protein-glutamate methyltransferase CheB [Chondromyces crocatus]AKT36211.1 chemotaxis protein CheY [Chondromyces crocatus]
MNQSSGSGLPIRVLVVDDSAFVRKVLREVLGASADIEVVGAARDGLEALEQIAALRPDVITLDLIMPNLDGFGVLANLPTEHRPRVVVVSTHEAQSILGLAALEAGAIDVVHKPTALATTDLYDLATELLAKVRAAGRGRPPAPLGPPAARQQGARAVRGARAPQLYGTRLVAIGTSTGGPQALARLLPALPQDLPVPLVIALHIPIGYTADLARRLNERSTLEVVEGSDRLLLRPGLVVLARAGQHLRIEHTSDGLHARLDAVSFAPFRPSVDILFHSAVEAVGAKVVGVLLTGMGDDGCAGARAIHEAGGKVLTESESSCVVYGMPRSAIEAGVSTVSCTLERMAEEIQRWL